MRKMAPMLGTLVAFTTGCGGEQERIPNTYSGSDGEGFSATITLREDNRYVIALRDMDRTETTEGVYMLSGDSIFLRLGEETMSGEFQRGGTLSLGPPGGGRPMSFRRE